MMQILCCHVKMLSNFLTVGDRKKMHKTKRDVILFRINGIFLAIKIVSPVCLNMLKMIKNQHFKNVLSFSKFYDISIKMSTCHVQVMGQQRKISDKIKQLLLLEKVSISSVCNVKLFKRTQNLAEYVPRGKHSIHLYGAHL